MQCCESHLQQLMIELSGYDVRPERFEYEDDDIIIRDGSGPEGDACSSSGGFGGCRARNPAHPKLLQPQGGKGRSSPRPAQFRWSMTLVISRRSVLLVRSRRWLQIAEGPKAFLHSRITSTA